MLKKIIKPIFIIVASIVGIFLSIREYWRDINQRIDMVLAKKEAEENGQPKNLDKLPEAKTK